MVLSENKQRMARGELYYAFTPELIAERARCKQACARYNNAQNVSRRELTELFREYEQIKRVVLARGFLLHVIASFKTRPLCRPRSLMFTAMTNNSTMILG